MCGKTLRGKGTETQEYCHNGLLFPNRAIILGSRFPNAQVKCRYFSLVSCSYQKGFLQNQLSCPTNKGHYCNIFSMWQEALYQWKTEEHQNQSMVY